MALDLTIEVYTNDECDELFVEDVTGLYSTSNLGGYGAANNVLINDVTDVTITLAYTTLSTNLVFALTVVNGTITVATMTLGSATPVNILSLLTSTVWPPTSANPFSLTQSTYSATLPTFDDGVYTVTYRIAGAHSAVPFDYSTTENELVSCAVCCCISEKSLNIDINDTDALVANLIPSAYLAAAEYATDNGSVTSANSLLAKAAAVCADTDCGCGC